MGLVILMYDDFFEVPCIKVWPNSCWLDWISGYLWFQNIVDSADGPQLLCGKFSGFSAACSCHSGFLNLKVSHTAHGKYSLYFSFLLQPLAV